MRTCAICGREITYDERVLPEVSAYERLGRGINDMSGSSLLLRERTGRVAHEECVTRAKQGLNPTQEALL